MPYTGGGDPKLPKHVKKLSAKRRRKWVAVWNSVFSSTKNEGRAFAAANSAIKELEMEIEVKEIGEILSSIPEEEREQALEKAVQTLKLQPSTSEKNYEDGAMSPMVEIAPPGLGGATSFAEADSYRSGLEVDMNASDQKRTFDIVFDNIWSYEEMSASEKERAVGRAASELSKRIARPPTGQKSIPERLVDFFTGSGEKVKTMKKKEGGVEYSQSDYADVPHKFKAGTWKIRLAERRSGNFTVAQVGKAISSLKSGVGSDVRGRVNKAIDSIRGATAEQKKGLHARLRKVKGGGERKKKKEDGAFFLTKDLQGNWRWLAVFSNKFRDREGEIFSEKSHEEFEAWVDATKAYPELRLWHVPGSRVGTSDYITYADGFQIASGTVDEGMEDVAESLAAAQKDLAVSHGYKYPESKQDEEGVYEQYRSFEITILPVKNASNLWTSFSIEDMVKEVNMGLKPEKRAFLVEHLGEERAAKIEESLVTLSKDLEESGIGFKDLADAVELETDSDSDDEEDEEEKTDEEDEDKKSEEPAAGTSDSPSEGQKDLVTQLQRGINEAVQAAIAPFTKQLEEIEGQVKELSKTEDERIADKMKARTNVSNIADKKRPTDSEGNVIDDKEAAEKGANTEEEESSAQAVNPYVADLMGKRQVAP